MGVKNVSSLFEFGLSRKLFLQHKLKIIDKEIDSLKEIINDRLNDRKKVVKLLFEANELGLHTILNERCCNGEKT